MDPPRIDTVVLAFAVCERDRQQRVFGAVPAWQLARTDLRTALGDDHAAAPAGASAICSWRRNGVRLRGPRRRRAARPQLRAGHDVDPGFDVDRRVTVRVSLPLAALSRPPQRAAFYAQLFDRFARCRRPRRRRGVGVAVRRREQHGHLRHRVAADVARRRSPHADWRSASPRYFTAMNLRLVAGRLFDDRDAPSARASRIVDERPRRSIGRAAARSATA